MTQSIDMNILDENSSVFYVLHTSPYILPSTQWFYCISYDHNNEILNGTNTSSGNQLSHQSSVLFSLISKCILGSIKTIYSNSQQYNFRSPIEKTNTSYLDILSFKVRYPISGYYDICRLSNWRPSVLWVLPVKCTASVNVNKY